MHPTHRRGASTEYKAAAYFAERGWEVFWPPSGSSPCDFIISRQSETQKVQVKTATIWTRSGSTYTRVRLGGKVLYKPGDFDLLVAWAPTDRLWVIPFEALPDKTMIYLVKDGGAHAKTYGFDKYEVTDE